MAKVDAEIVDMFSLSETKPKIRRNLISREQYLDFLDQQSEEYKVLCVDGVDGVGVSTTLALFAQRHSYNCASYFNNGWSRHLLNPQAIVRCLLRQLTFYTKANLDPNEEETTLVNSIFRLNRLTRNTNNYIYFVFDGLAKIPSVYVDGIKTVLAPLFSVSNARFIFSGNKDDIKQLLPDGTDIEQTNKLLKFQNNDVSGYLINFDPNIGQEDINIIYVLSDKGLARNLTILVEKLQKEGMETIRGYYSQGVTDFYADDYAWIEEQQDEKLSLLMALLTFSEIPLTESSVRRILDLTEEEMTRLIERCQSYVEVEDAGIALRSDDFRKYLREKLAHLKTEVELLLIDVIEKSTNMGEQFMFLPALYKHVKDNKQLVDYLTSANVQHYLEGKRSQAALNEQCEYGYYACSDFESQAAAYFRFAINRSVSREIEKNELPDTEIEALIAIGEEEKAFALTQSVFLMEERLKCLLIIAQSAHNLSDAMREEIDKQIVILADSIKFEFIPDKALELAKLMLPVKMEKALEIIDKVAKVTKDRQQIDRLYTAISISFNNEGKSDDNNLSQKADLASSKIEDDNLRKMATVMKSIMKESTASQVVEKMKELPASHQLYFLKYWIPDHRDKEDVGVAVEYAIQLVIDTSQTITPKVTLLKLYCKPLPDMKEEQVRKVVNRLDAIVANIKYPTVEYVKLIILIIIAVVKFDKKDAEDRLISLYMEILDSKDKALQAHCKSLLLRNFAQLGNPDDVEDWLGKTARELQEEIIKDIEEVLSDSAYHMKVVEGPIAALVCVNHDFVKNVIAKMNTAERRSRAYLHATQEYALQTDIKKMDWQYFIKLFHNISYDTTDRQKPLYELVNKITEVKDKDENLLEKVKTNYNLFKEAEQAEAQCYYFARLYVWLRRYYEDEAFQQMVKDDLNAQWQLIDSSSLKVDVGYHIAKVMSKLSMKQEAREYVGKAAEIRKNQLLASMSCLAAYTMSFGLYTHSLGILIRSELWKKEDLDQFKILMDYDGTDSEAIILWSRVALEFYGVNNIEQFHSIMNKYVTNAIEKEFCVFDTKRILFHISPALYLDSEALFYDRLKGYDDSFLNACVESVARYIQTKYPYPEYTDTREVESQVSLSKKDYDILLDLMRHTKDDGFIFETIETMAKSIDNNLGRELSREQQRVLWDDMTTLVEERLPMAGGIQHNGYKIACLAVINGTRSGGSIDVGQVKKDIEAIGNRADQAFLYAHISNYLKKMAEKAEFIELAVKKTEGIDYTFDRFNRFALCLQDSFSVAKSKAQIIADKVMESLKTDKNGSYGDYQRMLDLVRDHDEQLADAMLEKMDDDPARIQYQKRLRERAASNRKIEAAKSDLSEVKRLNNEEQMRFFGKQMEVLIKNKCVFKDFNSTQPILVKVFENPITDTQDAVLFFMENLYQKNKLNKRYNTLLREIHQAIVDNLKIVVAIASGTQEKLERVNRIMNEKYDENDGFVNVGEKAKGLKRIVDWYKVHPAGILKIIDPYFSAKDLYIIKALMDENNQLNCSILTNNESDEPLGDAFQKGWAKWSNDLTGRVEVKSCCYEDDPLKRSPIHDRWWVLYDVDEDKYYGIRLASVSTLGQRYSEISEMETDDIRSAMNLFDRFFQNMVPRDNGSRLKYEEAKLR